MKFRLPDPEYCRRCDVRSVLRDSRRTALGYRRRRHQCPLCGVRWTSWQMLVNPRRIRLAATPSRENHNP
jgi:transcriptional regulator NrdR family protein